MAKLRYSGDGKDMTLDELANFVEKMKAAGVQGATSVYAELSTSGKIKEVAVDVSD